MDLLPKEPIKEYKFTEAIISILLAIGVGFLAFMGLALWFYFLTWLVGVLK